MATDYAKKAPIFTAEGPQFYQAAYSYFHDYATTGPYNTKLSKDDEQLFEAWVLSSHVPFDPQAKIVDYDMRGYWKANKPPSPDTSAPGFWDSIKAVISGGFSGPKIDPSQFRLGPVWKAGEKKPSIWRTPYSTKFYDSSNYATSNCPFIWIDNTYLIDKRDNTVIFGPKKTDPAAKAARKAKTRPKLQLSQLEASSDTLDLETLNLILKGFAAEPLIDSITSADVERTIDGASTFTLGVVDPRRLLMDSPYLASGSDIEIDGLWFRLVGVQKQSDDLTLTFEDREVAIMRTYNSPKTAAWGQMSRAQFIYSMVREVQEFTIPFICPEVKIRKQKASDQTTQTNQDENRDPGFSFSAFKSVTFKGKQATQEQLRLAAIILHNCLDMKARRKIMVCAIMTATTETVMKNEKSPDKNGSSGLFQQTPPGWGTRAQVNDPNYAARKFIQTAIAKDKADPTLSYAMLCQTVQGSKFSDGSNYAPWQTEADHTVTTFGVDGGDITSIQDMLDANLQNSDKSGLILHVGPDNQLFIGGAGTGDQYQFTRGSFSVDSSGAQKVTKEDTWTCSGRLADQVAWRRFMVSGSFYYVSEPYLFRSRPRFVIDDEFAEYMMNLDFTYDIGQNNAQITIQVIANRWLAPPGSIVQLVNMGVANGKWLVTDFKRSMFSPVAEITLKKPRPKLPEPSQAKAISGFNFKGWKGGSGAGPGSGDQYLVGTTLVQPIPGGYQVSEGPIHATLGLAGYLATDWMCDAGTPVVAMENGTIERFSGHDPANGPPQGIHGPFGWSIYLKGQSGADYFITHLGKRLTSVGAVVQAGKVIGTVGDYARWGGANHTHVGVHPPASGHPSINDLRGAQRTSDKKKQK
jgi:murein DD-endopeptidase MepM/ murein hydrolase activator NlpD